MIPGFIRGVTIALSAIAVTALPAHAEQVKKRDTIKSLEKKEIEVRKGKVIQGSSSLARENYRAFLDLVTGDPELRAKHR